MSLQGGGGVGLLTAFYENHDVILTLKLIVLVQRGPHHLRINAQHSSTNWRTECKDVPYRQ